MTRRLASVVAVSLAATVAYAEIPANHALRSAPSVAAISVDQLPKAEHLATPSVRVLLGYTRRPLHFPDGYTMGLFSFSYSTKANWLFLINCRDLSVQRIDMPNNDNGSHCAAMVPSGDVYFMPYANARAYRFSWQTRTFSTIETDTDKSVYTWDALGASNGRVYFGTYPNAAFGEYDPATNRWDVREKLVPNTTYVTNLSEDINGCIRFRAWGPDEVWMRFDPNTRDLSKIELPTGDAIGCEFDIAAMTGDKSMAGSIRHGEKVYGVTNPSGRVWEFAGDTKPKLLGDTGIPSEPSWWLKACDDGIAGVSYFGGMFRYDISTGGFTKGQLDNRAPGGNGIMFLEAIARDCVIGANYSQQNLFAIDPATGAVRESETVVARTGGEPMCAVGLQGKGYLGIYTGSILSVYDPRAPFGFGNNPREFFALGERYAQTRPRAAVTDGTLVYISSDSEYSKLGGALAVIDPTTEQVDVYHHLIKDQNLPSLAYDVKTKLVWGGTDRWGQMRSHPPTQPSALIYAFDPVARTVVHWLDVWPGADVVTVHGVTSGGVLVVSSGNEIALIDTATGATLYKGASPVGIPAAVRNGQDGSPYWLAQGVLYRWEVPGNVLTPCVAAVDARFVTESERGTWLFGTATSVLRAKIGDSGTGP
ncbi:MAG: hypothetical protein IT366_23785 [Candidatus Hydrogenedentes bacterium]|nr:hypothetical protein [Candidatus Hydrogenedentota bacterium]